VVTERPENTSSMRGGLCALCVSTSYVSHARTPNAPYTSSAGYVVRIRENFGSAAGDSVTGKPSSCFTTFTPCTSATIL